MILKQSRPNKFGFTLVEMLVAMAVTLLMMAALARAFGFVGAKVKDSRADVELSNKLRDISTRISDELKRCTVSLEPSRDGHEPQGYFLYYEGPMSDATSSLFRAQSDATGNLLPLDDSRYGDFDDYIAFTAVAQGDSWFYGKVPRFVLDSKYNEVRPENNDANTMNDLSYPADYASDQNTPVVIRSKYAEIIYFASPEYDPSLVPTDAAYPRYIDVDGDTDFDGDMDASENGLPDRLKIHRRVLLIRPDLNLASGRLPSIDLGGVPMLKADAWPTGVTTGVGATLSTDAVPGDAWMTGMTGVHQQCDLSVRRMLTDTGVPFADGRVAANSLADLSKPHNRFAHVRLPNRVLIESGTANFPTSMPVLALTNPATILDAVNFETTPVRVAPGLTPSTGPVVTPDRFSGFLHPEFVLGADKSHLENATDGWGEERLGEDLLTNNAIGFDVQVYDPAATFFTSDNGLVIGPSDAGYRDAINDAENATMSLGANRSVDDLYDHDGDPMTAPIPYVTRTRGGFVDLGYSVLAGGSLRGWQARLSDRRDIAVSGLIDAPGAAQGRLFLVTPFSGIVGYTGGQTSRTAYRHSLYRSGRIVTQGTTIHLYQPAFDTYTSFYESDGVEQLYSGGDGTMWGAVSATADQGSDGIDFTAGTGAYYGADDLSERETSPPYLFHPEAIRISVRIENPSTRQIRQATVVHRDQL